MINKEQIEGWRKAAPNFFRRQAKTARQSRYGWLHPRSVGFVFGCQRSGTKMVMRILENSPATRIYHENHASAFYNFQLRSDIVLKTMVALNPAPAQIFKPICDSHKADEILARWPRAKGLWIYRHFDDVANSATQKWGLHQLEVVAAVAKGELDRWGWRTERLSPAMVQAIQRVYRPDLSIAEGAMLFWYLRNAFFFELGLDQHPRMLLVNYESLVLTPEKTFPEIFAHLNASYDPSFLERVSARSVGKKEAHGASPEIRALCTGLLDRLNAYKPPETPVPSVLVLINTLGVGGAERYAVMVSNWLAEHGTKVSIGASPGGDLIEELSPKVRFYPLPLRRVRSELLRVSRQVREIVEHEKPSVILCNSLAVTWVAKAAAGGVPIVNVAHGWPEKSYRLVGPLMRVASQVVAVSPEVKGRLVGAGLPESQCEVIFNGVDLSRLYRREGEERLRARESLGSGEVLVVSVGRLTVQKAQHHVVGVAERLKERNVSFAIVGEGQRAGELEALIREKGLEDRVRLLGLRGDVPELLGSADIYLSTSDWEGMSLTIIEAMGSGLAVVATETEGSKQLLGEDCGVLVPVGDVEAMSRAVVEVLKRREELGRRAERRARAEFGHERMMRELVGVLKRAG